MSGNWTDRGSTDGVFDAILPGPHNHAVENTDTGQVKEVYVGPDQTVGEAIQNGQFTDRDLSHMNSK